MPFHCRLCDNYYCERKHCKCIYWYPVSNDSHIIVTQGCIVSHHQLLIFPLSGHSCVLSKAKHRKGVFVFRDAVPVLMAVLSQRTRAQRELSWWDTKVLRRRTKALCVWAKIWNKLQALCGHRDAAAIWILAFTQVVLLSAASQQVPLKAKGEAKCLALQNSNQGSGIWQSNSNSGIWQSN